MRDCWNIPSSCNFNSTKQLLSTRVEDNRARIADDAKCGMEEDVVNGKIPKPDHYLDHCLRLVEAKLMSFDEMIAETKTMLAGVSIEWQFNGIS